MFLACRPSHFLLFRNERRAPHFAHFGRALNQGPLSFYKDFVPTALLRNDPTKRVCRVMKLRVAARCETLFPFLAYSRRRCYRRADRGFGGRWTNLIRCHVFWW